MATSSTTATSSQKYVQDLDYHAKIALKNVHISVVSSGKVTEWQQTTGMPVSAADLICNVRIWSREGEQTIAWTTEVVQKLGGLRFKDKLPINSLLGGIEGRIIQLEVHGKPLRFLCAQQQTGCFDPFEEMVKRTLNTQEAIAYYPIKGPTNADEYIKAVAANLSPQIKRTSSIARAAPNLDSTLDKRIKSLFQKLQRERLGGKTNFKLRVSDGGTPEEFFAHSDLLEDNSKFFANAFGSGMRGGIKTSANVEVFEFAGRPGTMKLLLDYLYDNKIPNDLDLNEYLYLLDLEARLELKNENSTLREFCYVAIKHHISEETLWDVVHLAELNQEQELLDIAGEYLESKKISLLQIVELPILLEFIEKNHTSRISSISLICEHLRSALAVKTDPQLWLKLYQFSQKNQDKHPQVIKLHDFCNSITSLFPAYHDE